MGLFFKWRRDKGRDFFHEADVSELLSAVRGGNRPTALRKAVGIINACMNDLPQGIHKSIPVSFDNDPKKLDEYADQLQTVVNEIDMKLGRAEVTKGKRSPTPAQVETYNKEVDQWNKLDADLKELGTKDNPTDADKKKKTTLENQQKAIKAKLEKFDVAFPDYDPDAEVAPDATGLPDSGEDGVGVVSWILIVELVIIVIGIIRDISQQRKAKPQPA